MSEMVSARPGEEPDAALARLPGAVRAQVQWDEGAVLFSEHWSKQIRAALKKVEVDDLGAMGAARLWEAIPEEDGAGRGRKDLAAMENELSVKVCFCEDGHVLLVGSKAKLQKKCVQLRNLLSHYHWRLTGTE